MPIRKDLQRFFLRPDMAPANQEVLLEAMDYQVAINWTDQTERARSIYRPMIDLIMNGEMTAAEALNQVKTEIEDILQGRRR